MEHAPKRTGCWTYYFNLDILNSEYEFRLTLHHNDGKKEEFECFRDLPSNLQEIFGLNNSKHNSIGYINDICSEDKRWEFQEQMKKSLENPKNDLGN